MRRCKKCLFNDICEYDNICEHYATTDEYDEDAYIGKLITAGRDEFCEEWMQYMSENSDDFYFDCDAN